MKSIQKIRKNAGITLVSLIVTIIILMILAGVVIATVTGNNGILSKTKFAKDTYQNSASDENNTLSKYENEIDMVSTRNSDLKNEPVEITILDSRWIIEYNNSRRIGDMVFLNFILKNTHSWSGWNNNIAQINENGRILKDENFNTNSGWDGKCVGEVTILQNGNINIYNSGYSGVNSFGINVFYYVGQ